MIIYEMMFRERDGSDFPKRKSPLRKIGGMIPGVNQKDREPGAGNFSSGASLLGSGEGGGIPPYLPTLHGAGEPEDPKRGKFYKAKGAAEAVHIIRDLADEIVISRVLETIDKRHEIPITSTTVPMHKQEREASREYTSRTILDNTVNDPELIQIDTQLDKIEKRMRRTENTGLFTELFRQQRELVYNAAQTILRKYGVDSNTINAIYKQPTVEFPYKNNFVRLSIRDGVTEVVAWDRQLSPKDRERVWEEHQELVKQGAPLAWIQHYQKTKTIPQNIDTKIIKKDSLDIEAAFNEHKQQLDHHAIQNGFQQFQLHSPDSRFTVPTALHILEQPIQEIYPIIATYSATNSFIAVPRPGVFTHIRHSDVAWKITQNGKIEAV